MRITALLLLVFLLSACGADKLNLLIIHTDQQSQWTVGAYGLDELRGPLMTPNLDALAQDGILFTNFFTNSAVCSPSRAIMMTGCYATRNGVSSNNMVLNDIPTIADYLNEAGYVTGYAGKWHISGTAKPGWAPDSYGWEDNRFMFNRGHYKKITEESDGTLKAHPYKQIGDEKSFTTDWLTDKTIDFLQEHKDEAFAYMVSYPDPHQPWAVREPFNSMYLADDMTIPLSYPQRLDPLNSWHNEIINKSHKNLNVKRLQSIKAMYSGSVNLIDHNVGRLMNQLFDLELYEKTMIVFTSDHGEYMGEHGMLYKNQYFEAAYRLPMIVRLPGEESGLVQNEVFSMVDFMPGVLSLLGIEVAEDVQGRDFSMVLEPENDWDELAYVHHASHSGAGVFTPEYYLILRESGENLLFDRVDDPNELYNLYFDPAYVGLVDTLTGLVLGHNVGLGTPAMEWLE